MFHFFCPFFVFQAMESKTPRICRNDLQQTAARGSVGDLISSCAKGNAARFDRAVDGKNIGGKKIRETKTKQAQERGGGGKVDAQTPTQLSSSFCRQCFCLLVFSLGFLTESPIFRRAMAVSELLQRRDSVSRRSP